MSTYGVVMAVRPPQNDSSGPDVVEFGIAALAARLDERDVEFPSTSTELLETLGNQQVPYDASGNTVRLEEVFQAVSQERFESQADLLDRLHPVFEEYRTSARGGIFSRLRQLLPF
jgi:hypothetical protein